MRNPRLPSTVGSLTVRDDGVLSLGDVDVFPWYTKEGFLGGTVRYRLVAEEVDIKELCKTQETK